MALYCRKRFQKSPSSLDSSERCRRMAASVSLIRNEIRASATEAVASLQLNFMLHTYREVGVCVCAIRANLTTWCWCWRYRFTRFSREPESLLASAIFVSVFHDFVMRWAFCLTRIMCNDRLGECAGDPVEFRSAKYGRESPYKYFESSSILNCINIWILFSHCGHKCYPHRWRSLICFPWLLLNIVVRVVNDFATKGRKAALPR